MQFRLGWLPTVKGRYRVGSTAWLCLATSDSRAWQSEAVFACITGCLTVGGCRIQSEADSYGLDGLCCSVRTLENKACAASHVVRHEWTSAMPSNFDLIITADYPSRTAELRLLDEHGSQLAYRQTDFKTIAVSQIGRASCRERV